MRDKKARERLFLKEVTTIFPYFPNGTVIDSEQPDFLISVNQKIIGVELVDYVRGQNKGDSSYRRNEVLWQRVTDKAKVVFETQHAEPLMVHLHWYKHKHLHQSEVNPLANEIATIIKNHIPVGLFDTIQIKNKEMGNGRLSFYAHGIHVTRTRNKEQSLWSFINSGFISVPVTELQELINNKDIKVTEYLKKCDEVWLVIVADGSQISSNVDLHQDVIEHDYNTDFTNILFYNRLNRSVMQLRVKCQQVVRIS